MRKMPDYEIKYGTPEWYLYHHYKNEAPVVPLILLSCFLFICKGGLVWIMLVWGIYFSWASKNNIELDNDPEVLRKRQSHIAMYEHLHKSDESLKIGE